MLGGKLAAEVVCDRALGQGYAASQSKSVRPDVLAAAASAQPHKPVGVKGEGAIAFGGGAVMAAGQRKLLQESDPANLVVDTP